MTSGNWSARISTLSSSSHFIAGIVSPQAGPRNAPTPALISTYDGASQPVHPDVLDTRAGFAGYRYWMGMTPYSFGDDTVENPSIRVSHDGVHWKPLEGAPDPVIAPPSDPDLHHADPDLLLSGERLFMYYLTRSRSSPHAMISVTSTSDGRVWTPPRVLLDQRWGVSPAIVPNGCGGWHMYYVHADLVAGPTSYVLRRRSGSTEDRFADECACVLSIDGHHLWHIDVIATPDGYEALVTAFPHRSDPSRSRLFHATSADGLHFSLSQSQPVLAPSVVGWDNRMIYRSTFVRRAVDDYQVWYSAGSWGLHFGIGIVSGPIGALRPVVGSTPARRSVLSFASRRELVGLGKYLIRRYVPISILTRIRPGLLGAAADASR